MPIGSLVINILVAKINISWLSWLCMHLYESGL
uniref:Uncharacterized protein n=1 Tax=Arundo donax TaxID=35708 RepID=A0A0A9BF73_ARUDO